MATIIRKEIRKRGLFGWLFLLVFFGFNILMLAWLVGGISAIGKTPSMSEAESAGRAIGTMIGMSFVLFIWACGAVVLGLIAFFTRGRKVIVEETIA